MTRSRLITILLGLSLLLFGCVRREGRNSDCKWTSAPTGVDRRDLRADLEFAEELAIRYMEAHAGPRDQAVAAKAKNYCMGILLAEIGKERGVSAQEAFRSFGQRAALVDLMMNLPFLFVLVLAGDFAARRLLVRYPPSDGRTPAVMMICFGFHRVRRRRTPFGTTVVSFGRVDSGRNFTPQQSCVPAAGEGP